MTFTAGDNWVNNVIELLKDKWDTENVAKPVIQHVTDPTLPKRHSLALQGKDYVLVYHVSTARENQDIGMYRAKQTTTMSLDINTIYQYSRLDSLEKEILRILYENRKNPTDTPGSSLGFNVLKPIRKIDLSNKQYKIWRYVWDIELTNFYISTSS